MEGEHADARRYSRFTRFGFLTITTRVQTEFSKVGNWRKVHQESKGINGHLWECMGIYVTSGMKEQKSFPPARSIVHR